MTKGIYFLDKNAGLLSDIESFFVVNDTVCFRGGSGLLQQAIKEVYGDYYCSHVWILPYPTAELRDNEDAFYEYYDSIEIASDTTGNIHPKAAFQARNRMMVDRSDLVIFYVDHPNSVSHE